jgi:hypothetical protein
MSQLLEHRRNNQYEVEVLDDMQTPIYGYHAQHRSELPIEQTASNVWSGVVRGVLVNARDRSNPSSEPWPNYLEVGEQFSAVLADALSSVGDGLAQALETFRVTILEIIEPVAATLADLLSRVEAPTLMAPARSKVHDRRDIHAGLAMVDDLRSWLDESIDNVALSAGLSPSTIYHWADNPSVVPRAEKISLLIRLHTLMTTIIDERGLDGARSWLRQGSPSPLHRLRVAPVVTIEQLESELYGGLLARPGSRGRMKLDTELQTKLMERVARSERDQRSPKILPVIPH